MPAPTFGRESAVNLDDMRDDIARITHRGIGMPAAGIAYWLACAELLHVLPLAKALFFCFVATGVVFPLGLAISKWIGADLFSKGHPLTRLGATLNFVQFAYWPIIVLVSQTAPEWTIYAMAVLFGSHFLPYGWFYRSAGYIGLGVGSIVVPTALVLAGVRAPEHIALAMAAMYAACVVRVHFENKRTFALAGA